MSVDGDLVDRLLTGDPGLAGVDRDRFRLDLSEIIDEAERIASLPNTAGSASELLAAMSGAVAHLVSHWERLARESDSSEAHAELLKVARSVTEDDLRWWQRLRRH